MAGASGGRRVGEGGIDWVRPRGKPAGDEARFTVKGEAFGWDGCRATTLSKDCIPSVPEGKFGVEGNAALSRLGVVGMEAGSFCGEDGAEELGDGELQESVSL